MNKENFNPVLSKQAPLAKTKTLAKPKFLTPPPAPVPGPTGSAKSPEEHMARRRQAGASVRDVAAEFGTSKSTAHRKTSNVLKTGFTKIGKAGD